MIAACMGAKFGEEEEELVMREEEEVVEEEVDEREREWREEESFCLSLYLSKSSHNLTISSNEVYLLMSEMAILYLSSSESQKVVMYSS